MPDPLSLLPEAVREQLASDPQYRANFFRNNPDLAPKTDKPWSRMPKIRPKRADGYDSATEAEYASILEAKRLAGEILTWCAKPKFDLGGGVSYTPDFMVVYPNPTAPVGCNAVAIIEVKGGHIWDDSKVKFKVARGMFRQLSWRMVQKKNGVWSDVKLRGGK